MKFVSNIESFVNRGLPPFKLLQVIIAAICILIPLLLMLADKDEFYPPVINSTALSHIQNCTSTIKIETVKDTCCKRDSVLPQLKICESGVTIIAVEKVKTDRFGFRTSMSDYVNSSRSYLFGLLYCLAALLFVFNGVIYIKINRRNALSVNKNGQWYNIFIGVFLIGVVLSPQCDSRFLHNLFTGLFFAGNLITLFFARNPGESNRYVLTRKLMAILIITVLVIKFTTNWFTMLYAEWISLTFIGIHLIMVAVITKSETGNFKNAAELAKP